MEDKNSELTLQKITSKMLELFERYEHYDLTSDILAAWNYHQVERYPGACFDCVNDIGILDEQDHYHPRCKPDFILRFPDFDYAIIGEVKASLSVGKESLEDLSRQIKTYCAKLYSFRLATASNDTRRPKKQDVLLVIPSGASAAVARYFREHLSDPPYGQHIALCQFESEEDQTRIFRFNSYPLQTSYDRLRDDFLPEDRRLSKYLGHRIELRQERYETYRNNIIANSDGMLSNLGVLMKIFEAVEQIYGHKLRRETYGDSIKPPPLRFRIDNLIKKLFLPPYKCGVKPSDIKDLFRILSQSATFVSIEPGTGEVELCLSKSPRFSRFRRAEVRECLPPKYCYSERLHLAFHLARGILLEEQAQEKHRKEMAFLIPLPFKQNGE